MSKFLVAQALMVLDSAEKDDSVKNLELRIRMKSGEVLIGDISDRADAFGWALIENKSKSTLIQMDSIESIGFKEKP